MRFSLKWILAGTVYVAIAAAAFSFASKTWIYCDVLWALTLLTTVYFGVATLCCQGKQRAAAAGFAFASVVYLGILATTQGKTTGGMILNAVGVKPNLASTVLIRSGGVFRSVTTPPPGNSFTQGQVDRITRAANAIATLAFGLMGSLVGLMAFRASVNADYPLGAAPNDIPPTR